MSRRSRKISFIALSWLAGAVLNEAVGTEPTTPVEQMEEVTIEGQRLDQMRRGIVAAEDRFYALFNELNKKDEFDVHCVNEAPLGTRFLKRTCQPEFLSQAEVDFGLSNWLLLRGDAGGGSAKSPTLVALEREAEYKAAMRKLVKDNPALLKLLRERSRLEEQYNRARRKRFKGQ